MERFIPVEIFRKTVITLEVLSACNLYGNFGENFPSNGISIFFLPPKTGTGTGFVPTTTTTNLFFTLNITK